MPETVVLEATPPSFTVNKPPLLTVVLEAVPPLFTSNVPPLLTVVVDATPPLFTVKLSYSDSEERVIPSVDV